MAVLVAARDEEDVIAQLLKSIRMQDYPGELIDIYVVADNCEDATADIAGKNGAIVYERFNRVQIGKGYALCFLVNCMKEDGLLDQYDGYLVFDADNLLEKSYIREMNRTFCDGYQIITSCRNAKNFGTNWLTASYGLWFLHEAQWINKGRMLNRTSCGVSGTGFFFSGKIMEQMDGWNHVLLTEDIEFTMSQILQGEMIGYCDRAVFYDEQPGSFKVSWDQRKRWIKGYQQVFSKYGKEIFGSIRHGIKTGFACFDMTMYTWPALFITIFMVVSNLVLLAVSLISGQDVGYTLSKVGRNFLVTYLSMMLLGGYTLFTEWRQIRAGTGAKIKSLFAFPVFMFSFAPIAIAALTGKVEWKPIQHHCVISQRHGKQPIGDHS
ncbi:MAG: glycosyltransferase [Clostridiales bacterium]|nr:glycosyltransferase [Clostridiales bacterium]